MVPYRVRNGFVRDVSERHAVTVSTRYNLSEMIRNIKV